VNVDKGYLGDAEGCCRHIVDFAWAGVAGACTCVSEPGETPKSQMSNASLVFRGTVRRIKTLPQHPEMKGRRRYAATFRIDEYWKGAPGQIATIYFLDAGCLAAGYETGKEYLVYGSLQEAKDYRADDIFLYGWTDVLPPGTPMLVPTACTPDGQTSSRLVRDTLRELGPGRLPLRTQ